jgi:zinc protease
MLAILLTALVAAPSDAKAFPFPIEMHTLPNGLRVAFVTYDAPGLVAYYTLMRVGSRNEVEKGRSGYAHFFEHMMFSGTKAHSAREYDDTMTGLGLSTNAFTDNDLTVYHLYGPAKALPTIIEYEADRFQNLDYSEAAFRTEAGAILGEYLKSASDPEQKLYERMMETAYTTHPYRHTVIGYLEDIKNMPAGYEYSREFFRRYYTPDDAIIFIAGDFDRANTLAMIEKAYGGWKNKLDAQPVPAEPKQTKARRGKVDWDKPTLPRLWIAWHAPSANELKLAALQNLMNAYLFGPTSPLYQGLVLGKQLVDSMDATYGDHRDPYLFGVLLRVKDAKNLKAVESAVLNEIKALAGGRVDAKRMDAVRSNLKYSNIMSLDKADSVAVSLAVNTALTGDVEFLNQEFDALAALKPADLQTFAKKYLLDANRTTVTLVTGGAK